MVNVGKKYQARHTPVQIAVIRLAISPVVIEQTAKSWKLAKLISWIVVVIGILTLPYGGFTLIFFGLIAVIVCKFGIYWNHK